MLMSLERSLSFDKDGFDDLMYWIKKDRRKAEKIGKLLEEIRRDPFTGKGKPELLKHDYSGFWSRRIDKEHRIVYSADDVNIYIISCRYHY